MVVAISLIIPTLNRRQALHRTIESISVQEYQPDEILIIDASTHFVNESYTFKQLFPNLKSNILHLPARQKGSAKQRNYGVEIAKNEIIGFADDDILLEKKCIENLYRGLTENESCGGINAIISNQSFSPLGMISKMVYWTMGINTNETLYGKCVGPVITFLPAYLQEVDVIKVDWLNTTCTLYRKEALPNPVFDEHFTGYSLMEDLALSLRVGQNWTLLNSPRAVIYHDSQPGEEKNNLLIMGEMDLVNRYYIMKYILHHSSFKHKLQLLLQQVFSGIATKQIFKLTYWKAKMNALQKIRSL
ncbi:glycosyltransferase [uncultured Pedobacter sp.]|uniref:glycosyltransferase family 2 protein n=1 Tax=uncultured Pedobacter sp. TaxID=246139 RepID=UPI0025DE2A59|nr:glycosyltransferase [uncultured Pedobacter sp.]